MKYTPLHHSAPILPNIAPLKPQSTSTKNEENQIEAKEDKPGSISSSGAPEP
jgi:hypothetical protein